MGEADYLDIRLSDRETEKEKCELSVPGTEDNRAQNSHVRCSEGPFALNCRICARAEALLLAKETISIHQISYSIPCHHQFSARYSFSFSPCWHTPLDVPHHILQLASVLNSHQRGDLHVARRGTGGRLLVGLGLLLAGGHGVVTNVSTRAIGGQVGVVHCRVQRDRSSRAHIVVRVLEDERL